MVFGPSWFFVFGRIRRESVRSSFGLCGRTDYPNNEVKRAPPEGGAIPVSPLVQSLHRVVVAAAAAASGDRVTRMFAGRRRRREQ